MGLFTADEAPDEVKARQVVLEHRERVRGAERVLAVQRPGSLAAGQAEQALDGKLEALKQAEAILAEARERQYALVHEALMVQARENLRQVAELLRQAQDLTAEFLAINGEHEARTGRPITGDHRVALPVFGPCIPETPTQASHLESWRTSLRADGWLTV